MTGLVAMMGKKECMLDPGGRTCYKTSTYKTKNKMETWHYRTLGI
jgi:hypothetical protein